MKSSRDSGHVFLSDSSSCLGGVLSSLILCITHLTIAVTFWWTHVSRFMFLLFCLTFHMLHLSGVDQRHPARKGPISGFFTSIPQLPGPMPLHSVPSRAATFSAHLVPPTLSTEGEMNVDGIGDRAVCCTTRCASPRVTRF